MTYAKREEIFSKDCLSIQDIQDLFGLGYDDGAKLIRTVKDSLRLRGVQLRLDINGKLHVEDYFEYFRISNMDRYLPVQRSVEIEEKKEKEGNKV
jgi:hypothetical protein